MINFPDSGYTPDNLKTLLAAAGWRREEAAVALGVSLRAVHRWCVDPTNHNHRDMPFDTWRRLISIIEEKTMINELQFNCSAVTHFIRKTAPNWREQLQSGKKITSELVGDSNLQATLSPTSNSEGMATLFRGKETIAIVPYCIDAGLNIDEGGSLCIGMTLFESRRMTQHMRDIEQQRSSLIEQYGRINERADMALDLAGRATMSGPYDRRSRP